MSRTAKTQVKVKNTGILIPGVFDTFDLNGSLLGSDEGLGIADIDDGTGIGGANNYWINGTGLAKNKLTVSDTPPINPSQFDLWIKPHS